MFEKIQRFVRQVLKQEYARASIYYVAANIIGQGIVLISSAIFTRMMSKADYGLVSTYSTWVLVLNTFICLNLFISVRTAYIDFREDYDRYNSSVLLLSLLCGILMTVIIACAARLSGLYFGMWEILLACVQSVALNIINFMLAVQSMKNEYRQRVFMMIAPNWAHILVSVVLMLIFTGNLYMAKIAGNALGLLVFGVICSIILFFRAAPRVILRYWEYALKISVPSIFSILSDLILMQCDRLMLTSMVGAEETAEYTIVYNVSSIIVAIYQAINGSWLPWFLGNMKAGDIVKIKKYQRYYMLFFTVFSCGMMTISPELIKIIAPENYWKCIRYVAPIVAASYLIFLYAFFSAYLLYKKKTARMAVNTIIAAVLNLVLNYVLIPRYQSAGAVGATLVSYMVLFILHLIAVQNEGKQCFSLGGMWRNAISVMAFGIIFYFVRDVWMLRYAVFTIVFLVVYFVKGREIIREFLEDNL